MAAASVRVGDFDKAIAWQKKALAEADFVESELSARARLELYEAGRRGRRKMKSPNRANRRRRGQRVSLSRNRLSLAGVL